MAAQHDSAESPPTDLTNEVTSAYIYADFRNAPYSAGLLEPLGNRVSRPSVVRYLTSLIGDETSADALIRAAERHRLDPALLVALSWQESRFKADATGFNTNGSVDRGLLQLNSSTFTGFTAEELFEPYRNADLGAAYLKDILQRTGNPVVALAMYNAGPGRVGSTGAPQGTLDYISAVIDYREGLIKGYRETYPAGGVLVSRDVRPVKNPDRL